MRHLPLIMLVLALPAGAIGYAATVWLLSLMSLPAGARGMLELFVPLFVAGLCMMPFIAPFIDRQAKAALAAAPGRQGASAGTADPGEDARSDADTQGDAATEER